MYICRCIYIHYTHINAFSIYRLHIKIKQWKKIHFAITCCIAVATEIKKYEEIWGIYIDIAISYKFGNTGKRAY